MKFAILSIAALAVFALGAMLVPSVRDTVHDFGARCAQSIGTALERHVFRMGFALGMAEFDSRQLAAREATPPVKTAPYDDGRIHVAVAQTPATAAWAQNDTWNTGIKIPKGARILRSGKLQHSAFGSSVTCDVGIRALDGTVVDVDGIADGLDIAAAGVKDLNSGSLFVGGIAGGVMTQEVEVYVSLLSANPTDDAQAEIEIHWVGPQA